MVVVVVVVVCECGGGEWVDAANGHYVKSMPLSTFHEEYLVDLTNGKRGRPRKN